MTGTVPRPSHYLFVKRLLLPYCTILPSTAVCKGRRFKGQESKSVSYLQIFSSPCLQCQVAFFASSHQIIFFLSKKYQSHYVVEFVVLKDFCRDVMSTQRLFQYESYLKMRGIIQSQSNDSWKSEICRTTCRVKPSGLVQVDSVAASL